MHRDQPAEVIYGSSLEHTLHSFPSLKPHIYIVALKDHFLYIHRSVAAVLDGGCF